MAEKTEQPKRERGRPANFPGQDVTARLYKLPNTTIALVEAEAAKRGTDGRSEPLGITIDRLIRKGHKEFNRNRK